MSTVYYIGVFLSIASAIIAIVTFIFPNHNHSRKNFKAVILLIFFVSVIITISFYFKEKNNENKPVLTENIPTTPGSYIANGTKRRRIYFYNSPDLSTRREAFIETQVDVNVTKVENGFGYIEFTNSRSESSFGWLEMKYLILKPK